MNIIRPGRDNIIKAVAQDVPLAQKRELAAQPQAPETKTPETKAPEAKTPEVKAPEALEIRDKVEISEKAKAKADDFQKMLEEMRSEMQALREGLKRAGEAGDGAAAAWKEKIQCLIIAMRIMSGDNVPEEDHRFLRERDVELYSRAIMMRIKKEDPEDYDRLSEEDEQGGNNVTDSLMDSTLATIEARFAESGARPAEASAPPAVG